MPLYFSEDGLPFIAGPYTDEDRERFEKRLRKGGDITIIHQSKPDRPAPSPDDPEQ